MAINLSPDQEQTLLSIAQKIRGSRGGRVKSAKKTRAVRRNAKRLRSKPIKRIAA